MELHDLIRGLGLDPDALAGGTLVVRSPVDGAEIARLHENTDADADAAIERASNAFLNWRTVPGPRRGELVRLFGEELRAHKAELGRLVSIEAGKILQEGLGEVQEMIDICDFAVGLSRQLYGLTIASERPGHRMAETWHPLGPVGVISAFNFPVAVWAWNAALALRLRRPGDLEAVGEDAAHRAGHQAIFRKRGRALRRRAGRPGRGPDRRPRRSARRWSTARSVPLISATGSTRHGPRGRAARGRSASAGRCSSSAATTP